MDEILTIEQMESRFPAEWVLLGDPQTDSKEQLLGGRVLFHSSHRDEVDRKMLELRPSRFALRYLGELPADIAMVL